MPASWVIGYTPPKPPTQSTSHPGTEALREVLGWFLDLDAYLDDQAIPVGSGDQCPTGDDAANPGLT